MKEAIAFLKTAAERKGTSQYGFHDGVAYARNAMLAASYPVPQLQGIFALAADDLDAALARMPAEPEITSADGSIVLKCNRLRSTLRVLPYDPPDAVDHRDFIPLPEGLLAALQAARPFAGTDISSWMASILLTDGAVRAIDGRVAIEIAVPQLSGVSAQLPTELAVFIGKQSEVPVLWYCGDSATAFRWASGAEVVCQHVALGWPSGTFEKVLAIAGDGAPVPIDPAFADAFDDAASFGSGEVAVAADGFHVRTGHGEHDVAHEIAVARQSLWSTDALKRVAAVATAWNPDTESGVARFTGDGLHGVIAGLRR